MEQDELEYLKKQNKKRLKRIIVSILLYLFGAGCIIGFFVDGAQALMQIVVGIILCGFYTGLTWRKAAQDMHGENERTFGVEYTITENGVYREDGFWLKFVFFLIGVVLGVVITPIRVIVDIVQYCRTKKIIKQY